MSRYEIVAEGEIVTLEAATAREAVALFSDWQGCQSATSVDQVGAYVWRAQWADGSRATVREME